jgi:ATP-dependent Lon protease
MTKVENLGINLKNKPTIIEDNSKNVYKINFKNDNASKNNQRVTRPAILQQPTQDSYVRMVEQQQKEQKKAKNKQNLSWGLGIAVSVAFLAVLIPQIFGKGGKDAKKIKELTQQVDEIKNSVIKREATEELARKDYERSIYRVQDLITLDKLASTTEKRTVADIGKVKESLDRKIFGQDKAKEAVTDFVGTINYDIKNELNLSKPVIIAIDGPPGTCKSTLMASAADGLGMYLKKIPLSSIEKPGSLVGFERTFVGAKAGAIAAGQIEGGSKKVFYMLDELEKCPGEVQNTLLSLLDDQAKFKDLYYNCEIDLSQSIFGITTNELERLKGTALYDRIKPHVIKVEKYDNATKKAIAKIKLEGALKENKMWDKVSVNDNVYESIAKRTSDDGGRETTQIAERLIITKLKNLLINTKDGEKITVDENFINKLLQK